MSLLTWSSSKWALLSSQPYSSVQREKTSFNALQKNNTKPNTVQGRVESGQRSSSRWYWCTLIQSVVCIQIYWLIYQNQKSFTQYIVYNTSSIGWVFFLFCFLQAYSEVPLLWEICALRMSTHDAQGPCSQSRGGLGLSRSKQRH